MIYQCINYYIYEPTDLGKILCCRILTTNHKLVWLRFDSARNEYETLFLFAA